MTLVGSTVCVMFFMINADTQSQRRALVRMRSLVCWAPQCKFMEQASPGFKQEGARYGWHDGVAIVFAAMVLVAFSSIANFWRQREMMKLAKRRGKLEFTVQRGEGCTTKVAISDIKVGDKVRLGQNDEVPADGLLVNGDILVMEEATQSKRDCEGNPFLVAGSKVLEGHGLMLVASVGSLAEMPRSIGLKMGQARRTDPKMCWLAAGRHQPELTPLQSSMSYNSEKGCLLGSLIEKPISYIDKASLLIFTLDVLVVFIRLTCKKDGDSNGLPEIKGNVSLGMVMEVLEKLFLRPPGRIFIFTGLFTVVVLCVQHGVPLMVTMSLNDQIDKVESDQDDAVLHDLSACTTMGLVTVICIDVSGGLISKPMEVSRIWMGETEISNKVEGSETDLVVLEVLKQGVGLSILAPELSLSPMSRSLVFWAETAWEMNMKSLTENFDILNHRNLSSDKEGSGVLVRKAGANEQALHLHWSGAASTILEMCSHYYDGEGECCSMENQKIKFGQVIQEMEESGLKPIAFAHRETQVEELEQDELILIGLIGLKYTCQESTKVALKKLRDTKIKIKLVSGDDIMSVKDIACDLGLGMEEIEGGHVEGKQLQDLHCKARLEKVDQANVMGSFSLEDKLDMVQCLQEKGHVVAFIGRNLSHASVLKVADVGIVHDSQGRIMHRESSGISIKCFSALKPIVRAGRSKYLNIQKFIQLQLTFNISGLLISFMTTVSTGNSPLTAIQLIWVNVLMCLLGCIMMVMELSSEEQLANPPSNRNQPIITIDIWKNIVIQVFYQAFACMVLEFGGHVSDWEKRVRTTMIFNTFLLCQIFNQLNIMGLLKREILKIVVLQRYFFLFLVGLGGCFLVQVLVIEYAKGLADGMGLNATQWAICILVGALSWVIQWALRNLPDFLRTYCTSASNTPESITQPSWFYFFHLRFSFWSV
ncbi:putative calcium-transporting ATPase 13, plasma membrane-type isoform X2 [Lotus japonicus]|uniref:putative calcium-transporting ATPase 13, plasma membrane-type isoform X2 n=1 Tax=Lotus japonicus TaxID=34305 RepID=UPI002582923E|nr:putative calcium-transporting ATPase 13, plasma membrane-type isoform X2 [Lotus japonicus]